jgi:hypothetical protein
MNRQEALETAQKSALGFDNTGKNDNNAGFRSEGCPSG